MLHVKLTRKFTQQRDQKSGLEFLIRRVLSSKPNWEVTKQTDAKPELGSDNLYRYDTELTFTRARGHEKTESRDRERILAALHKIGTSAKFKSYPWHVQILSRQVGIETPETNGDSEKKTKHALADLQTEEFSKTKERVLPVVQCLLNQCHHVNGDNTVSDAEVTSLREHAVIGQEYFCGIFERDAQIRLILSSVKSFLETNGARRNHVVLYGLPACAKTQILNALAELIGTESVVRLDGTSTTPAGIYKVYFEEFEELPEPPFVILEEAEKTAEEALRVWLGVLDDRGELRKINAREMRQRELRVLCFSTVNDKKLFDELMKGALSSRFAHQLECPRPNRKVMQLILERDITRNGGRNEWIEPILRLSESTGTTDPRRVLSFIDGGDRLLDGSYQKDIIEVYRVIPKVPEIQMEVSQN